MLEANQAGCGVKRKVWDDNKQVFGKQILAVPVTIDLVLTAKLK
jgi:hypothetical protein